MKGKKERSALEISYLALMTALLLGGQFALSMVAGVEVVTVLLLTFSYSFGWKRGMIVATAFSLLRCFLFGFFPYVVVLYLLYFNVFAFLFGMLGRSKTTVPICPILLVLMSGACLYFALNGVPVSLMADRLEVFLWILFGLCAALLVLYPCMRFFGGERETAEELATVTVLGAFCTVCFTLLDDVLYPLWGGLRGDAAIAYFYNGFFAMIPQTVCTVLTVGALFLPLRKIFDFAAKKL
ncbi:MAG: hypothetical protein ACI4NG_05110 [Candidatus Gallimonas sp.]